MEKVADSKIVRAGKKTYFLDVRDSRNGKKFLQVTESRIVNDAGARERNRIIIFPEQATKFSEALTEMAGRLG